MPKVLSHADVIGLWGVRGSRDFAAALNIERVKRKLPEVSYWTVRSWVQRNSIPGEFWPSVEAAALSRGIGGVTIEGLAIAAERQGRREKDKAA